MVMKVVTTTDDNRGENFGVDNQTLFNELLAFYNQNHQRINLDDRREDLSRTHLANVLGYASTEMVTAYKNNITQNFIKYLKYYISTYLGLNEFYRQKKIIKIQYNNLI